METILYGLFISFAQERVGKFQKLEPKQKQLVNVLLTFIIPLLATIFGTLAVNGNLDELLKNGTVAGVPMLVWLVSQVGHQADRMLQKYGS